MRKPGAAILLIEDDPDVAAMFSLGLSIAGHEVEVAGDAGSAVLRASVRRFDLAFLDVELPRIDGVATLALLRSNWSTRGLPVAMLTNSADVTLHRRARSLGILDWLVKSETTPADLVKRVSAWTSHKEVTHA